jgi:pimeloyl-ACP methyl ester carboxylesterase
LWRYHESLTRAASGPLWRIGRSAAAESENDPLGDEYRALTVPTLYYWSQESTTPDTRLHLERHGVRNVGFAGGHWPMVEEPEATASRIAAFFDPLFSTAGVR